MKTKELISTLIDSLIENGDVEIRLLTYEAYKSAKIRVVNMHMNEKQERYLCLVGEDK